MPPSHQRRASLHRHTPGGDGRDIVPKSAEAPLAEHAANPVEHGGAGLPGGGAADFAQEKVLITTASTATASSANVWTHEREELAQFHQREAVAGGASVASKYQQNKTPRGVEKPSGGSNEPDGDNKVVSGGGSGTSSAADREKSAGDIGIGHAVFAAAQELAHHCQVPGISEAASAVCIMANLVTDSRENDRACESRLRRCRSIVIALKRADKVVTKVGCQVVVCFLSGWPAIQLDSVPAWRVLFSPWKSRCIPVTDPVPWPRFMLSDSGWRHDWGDSAGVDRRRARGHCRSGGAHQNVPEQEQAFEGAHVHAVQAPSG